MSEKQIDTMHNKPDERAIVGRVSFVTILGNVVLTVCKMLAGIFGHSGAMVSDAIHSMSDVLTTFIAYFGVRLSKKEPDKEHPYGHERLECVASMILGVILLVTGLGVGKVGLDKIIAGNYDELAVPGVVALLAAIVSIVGKELMYRYTLHYAKLIDSTAFIADAWHHRSDALSSIGSLIGIGGAMLGFPVLDPIASVVICLFILKVSYDVLKDALSKVLDTSCGEEYDKKIIAYVSAQENVISVKSMQSRMFGNKVYIDLEIRVDGNQTLWEAHAVAEQVHANVERDFPDVKHIMIHIEPA